MDNKNIAWLENNIPKAEKIVEAKREQAKNSPGSFSASLSLKSAEDHLAELQDRLAQEKTEE